jgi:hypothetical protein
MPVSRGTHNALKDAHFKLKLKYRGLEEQHRRLKEQQLTDRAADGATADTINRLARRADALAGILAGHLVGLERQGWAEEGLRLRAQLAAAEVDLSAELYRATPSEDALPAGRVHTALEARLIGELHRSEKARAAMATELDEATRVNDAMSRQLREQAEREETAA